MHLLSRPLCLLLAVCAFLPLLAKSTGIKHVIVLMLENRSLDHLLGFLKRNNPDVRGCLPGQEGCSNRAVPLDPTSAEYTVDDQAVYVQADPAHSISSTTSQIYPDGSVDPTMGGFIKSYSTRTSDPADGPTIMKCFSEEHLPVASSIATEFGFFDGWFASVPGPTMVNRAYASSATSNGMGTNDELTILKGMPQKTVFRQLKEMGLDYRVYWSDVPSVLMFKDMRHKDARTKYRQLDDLYSDLAAGDLPEFTWIEPAYFETSRQPATDQHPDHDVTLGEDLVKSIYDALRSSPLWDESALFITYDEHGGFFDHVVPPYTNVPNPDGKNSIDDPFDFTRLGIRIPTIVASPFIAKGSVFHMPDEEGVSQYDHTSMIATVVHKLFQAKEGYPQPEYLTKRDAWAKTFEGIFNTTARSDCPMTMPSPISLADIAPAVISNRHGNNPMSDLQRELLSAVLGAVSADAEGLTQIDIDNLANTLTEAEAGEFCRIKLQQFLQSAH